MTTDLPDGDPEVTIIRLPDGKPRAFEDLPERLRAHICAAIRAGASAGDFPYRGRRHARDLRRDPGA
jgi:hypothetical protein